MARGRAPRWACAHAPSSERSFQPPPGTTRRSTVVGERAVGRDERAVRRAHGGRAVEGDERRVEVVAHVGEARQHLPGRQRVELVEAVVEEHFASHGAQRGGVARSARQWQECHCAIDFRHASRDASWRCPTSSRSTSRPRRRSSATSRAATRSARAGRAPGAVPTTTGFAIDVAARARGARRRPTPCSSPGCARRSGRRRQRCSTRCARPTRAARAWPRSAPGAFVLAHAGLLDGRRATTHWAHAEQLAERYPAVNVDPDVLYVDEGDVLTSAGVAAGIDLCLHLVRRDHGAEVANAVARRIVVAPHRDGGQAQFVDTPLPAAAERGPRAPRAPGRWSACASRSRSRRWRATPRAASAPSRGASAPRRGRRRCSGCSRQRVLHARRLLEAHRPPGRGRRRPRRLRHRRLAALAFPPRDGHDTGRVSPQLPG